MLISIEDLRAIIQTDESDYALAIRLSAIEGKIRAYTNNDFIVGGTAAPIAIKDDRVLCASRLFRPGDSVELIHTHASDGVYAVVSIEPDGYRLSDRLIDSEEGAMSLVRYPKDVVMGAVDMLRHDLETEGREDVASETISRHSVTYRDPSSSGFILGYPAKLTAFLKPYRRARV